MVVRSVLVLVGLTFLGCGGGSGERCGAVQPCGGDVLGEWAFVAGCVDDTVISQEAVQRDVCPTAAIENVALEVSGMLAFQRDMTYSGRLATSISFDMRVPSSCLQGGTCSQLDAYLQVQVAQDPDPTFSSVSCAGTSTCTCRFGLLPMEDGGSGVYSTSGATLATSNPDGTTDLDEYCVRDDKLHILQVATMDMGAMGRVKILGDLVGSRVR